MWLGASLPKLLYLLKFVKEKTIIKNITNDTLFSFLNSDLNFLIKYIIKIETIEAIGIVIDAVEKKLLLYIPERYWIIDICPNLKWIFAEPKIILFSFIKLT